MQHCLLRDALTPKDAGTKSLNLAIGAMYIMGYWVRRQDGICIARHLLNFLQLYQKCAAWSMRARRNRYPIKPKMRMVAHCAQRMLREASLSTWITNPISESVQMQEDYIGKPSRLSRRVHAGAIHKRTMSRALICSMEALLASDSDARGLDGP